MNEAVVFSQPLDLLVVIILHQIAVISGSGLKVGVVSQIPSRKKNPPFQNPRSAPAPPPPQAKLISTYQIRGTKLHFKLARLLGFMLGNR